MSSPFITYISDPEGRWFAFAVCFCDQRRSLIVALVNIYAFLSCCRTCTVVSSFSLRASGRILLSFFGLAMEVAGED